MLKSFSMFDADGMASDGSWQAITCIQVVDQKVAEHGRSNEFQADGSC